jgi:hypothetical protein
MARNALIVFVALILMSPALAVAGPAPPFVNCVFVAGSFCGREISYDCLSPLGDNGTDSSEKDRIRTIVLGDGLWFISVKRG